MKILLCEDNDSKRDTIKSELVRLGAHGENIICIRYVSELARIRNISIDLIIIDLKMPSTEGAQERVAGLELMEMLRYLDLRRAPILAITSFIEEVESVRSRFLSEGCIIYDYNAADVWRSALAIFLSQSRERGRYDFIIVNALKKERDPYAVLMNGDVSSTQRNGLDILEFRIDGTLGAAIKMPKMGLVNASCITSKILEIYNPRVLAMSGICAGINDNVKLGQILVCDMVWEYQSGKWLDDAFVEEPYQSKMPERTRLTIEKLIETESLLQSLEGRYRGKHRPSEVSDVSIAPFTTGSAVIASQERLDAVAEQHRKVAGLDMEVFGLYRSAELSNPSRHVIATKVVVDKANEKKGDELHEYGCFISASFTVAAISALMKDNL